MPRRLPLAAAAAAVIAVAVPSVAHGATIHSDLRTPHSLLVYAGHDETNLVTVEGSQSVVIRDAGARLAVKNVPTCMPIDPHAVSCAAVRDVDLVLGNGPDVAVISTPHPVSIEGGIGNDRYVARAAGAPSRVEFDGGYGTDVANYFFATAGVRVSNDGIGGDGRPGDLDRIHRTVETVLGSEEADVLTGSARSDQLSGLDGDDSITGGAGPDVLSGGRGNDRIDARDGEPDTVDCGGWLMDSVTADAGGEASILGCAQVLLARPAS